MCGIIYITSNTHRHDLYFNTFWKQENKPDESSRSDEPPKNYTSLFWCFKNVCFVMVISCQFSVIFFRLILREISSEKTCIFKHQNKEEVSFVRLICPAGCLVSKKHFRFFFINISRCDEWLTRYDAANLMKFEIFQKLNKINMLAARGFWISTILMVLGSFGPQRCYFCISTGDSRGSTSHTAELGAG